MSWGLPSERGYREKAIVHTLARDSWAMFRGEEGRDEIMHVSHFREFRVAAWDVEAPK